MAACPVCKFANPDQARACGRCNRPLVAVTVPLPARMTEPIRPLSRPPADERPLVDVLDVKSVAVIPATPLVPAPSARPEFEPAPLTLRDPPADVFPTHDGHRNDGYPPGGTAPAHPGLPEYPMNDAALQNPPHTVPATDPANDAQRPFVPTPPNRPKLVVLRGLKVNTEYPIYEGRNSIGRFADKPVDIDLVSQESVEQIWCSRQHAVVMLDRGVVMVEDMNSLNGTWVNGTRIHPGQYHPLNHGDVVQVGTVQLKLVVG